MSHACLHHHTSGLSMRLARRQHVCCPVHAFTLGLRHVPRAAVRKRYTALSREGKRTGSCHFELTPTMLVGDQRSAQEWVWQDPEEVRGEGLRAPTTATCSRLKAPSRRD